MTNLLNSAPAHPVAFILVMVVLISVVFATDWRIRKIRESNNELKNRQ